jgi:predicted lipid carrier protein YhbT
VRELVRLRIARALLAIAVRGASARALERRFGSRLVQRLLFTAMAGAFDADAAAGFQGRLSYELARPATGAPPLRWTVVVAGRRAHARPGPADDAALRLRFTLADFMRVAAGKLDPAVLVLQNRASFKGDLGLAARLPEMFGATQPRQGRG